MRISALLAAVLMLAGAVGSANPPQTSAKTSAFREPRSVGDLLDACGEAVNEIDSPPAQPSATNVLKFGWCVGWVQGLLEHIVEVHLQARLDEMMAKKDGKPAPPPRVTDKGYLSICAPPETRTQDLIRAIVAGLQGLPGEVNEPKNGPVKEVLKKAYPCPATAVEDAKPPDAKP
jgi:hypothetical protein